MNKYHLINTRMGSENNKRFSNGNCYPACAMPHGMNFFTIQTAPGFNERWFYSPLSSSSEGIILTHMPSPWLGDYGKLIIYGQNGSYRAYGNQWSSYDPEKTVFEPAYINAHLFPDDYTVEVTPTERCAIFRFSFNRIGNNRIVIAGENISFKRENNTVYVKTSQSAIKHNLPDGSGALIEYIALKLDSDFDEVISGNTISLEVKNQNVELRLSASYISFEQAELNFERELAKKSFNEVKNECRSSWEKYLDKIDIEDENTENLKTFYSCMYRAFLWPRKFYELDRNNEPIHLNTATFTPAKGVFYTDNGFWDTYRTLYPYLSLIDTELYSAMAEGFYNHYTDTGWLPKWICPCNVNCMPGMLIEATLGDAIVKDIVTGELAENIFEAMLKDGETSSGIVGVGRVGLSEYRKLGYVPYTVANESVNETLDNTLGDYAIAAAAKKLNKADIAEKYFKYSKNYVNLFDKETGFIRGKDENGRFRDEIFDPYMWGRDYTEGSAWQNAFGVYHDIKGLDELYGGKLEEKIDELMVAPREYRIGSYGLVIHEMVEMVEVDYGQCAISNQPSFHVPYIYSELGRPEKTALHMKELFKRFNSGYRGFPGDEDNGTTSAWYLLSAMGLYQVAPSRPDFATSLPLFDKMTVKLANGNVLNIDKSKYDLTKMSGNVSYFDVMSGGDLSEIVKNKE